MRWLKVLAALSVVGALMVGSTGCKDNTAPTMLANMGGMEGVSKLMQNWGSAVAGNADLSKLVSSDDMGMIARGFTNEVAKASKIPMPNEGVDLPKVLKDKGLSKANLDALGAALDSAAGVTKLSPDATKAAMELWNNAVGMSAK